MTCKELLALLSDPAFAKLTVGEFIEEVMNEHKKDIKELFEGTLEELDNLL